jgi:hypothetical protein
MADLARSGSSFSFSSNGHPAVAASMARLMGSAGLKVVPAGTPGAVQVDVSLQAFVMAAGSLGRTAADVQVDQAIDRILADPTAALASSPAPQPASAGVTVPLTGWRTPIGQTGMSVGAAGFLLENLATATGVRSRVNAFFGADPTGTVCLFPAKACARSKGPQQDMVLKATYRQGDQVRSVTTAVILVQNEPNILQPLAYAMSDMRDAAMGKATPSCLFWRTGDRVPACEPVESPLTLKDLR